MQIASIIRLFCGWDGRHDGRRHATYAWDVRVYAVYLPTSGPKDISTPIRRGRCALDKCYAYGSGARRRESVTEQQATEQQASREAHLNTNGRKGNSSSVRSDTHQGVAEKPRGRVRTRRWILAVRVRYQQARASR